VKELREVVDALADGANLAVTGEMYGFDISEELEDIIYEFLKNRLEKMEEEQWQKEECLRRR
jgi:hypothetical protein